MPPPQVLEHGPKPVHAVNPQVVPEHVACAPVHGVVWMYCAGKEVSKQRQRAHGQAEKAFFILIETSCALWEGGWQ
jgi:hypothetical protein